MDHERFELHCQISLIITITSRLRGFEACFDLGTDTVRHHTHKSEL